MYIEQVPTPLIMPFAILPFQQKICRYSDPEFRGKTGCRFFLNGLGYYQPIGEHFDLKILSDIYTKGSWNLRPEMNYRKNTAIRKLFCGHRNHGSRDQRFDDYSKTGTYRIAWRHTQDSKANPFLTFSASVDIVSTNFITIH
jgi:hypothetical protein